MVGVGGQGVRHLSRLSQIEDVEIVALYDADTARADVWTTTEMLSQGVPPQFFDQLS